MRDGIRLVRDLHAGLLVWRVTRVLCGLLAVAALGLGLVGHYVQASLLVCVALALPRGLWWWVMRRRRAQ